MKFNKQNYTQIYEGGKAIRLDDKTELLKLCFTSFLENTFYETQEDIINRLNGYLENIDSNFILKLAIFSRNYGLRSINHYLVAKWIIKETGKKGMRNKLKNALSQMLRRPDELGEIIKAIEFINGKKYLPNSLKNVIKEILESGKFDEYQISKYKNQGELNLYDLVNLTHPKGEVFSKLIKGELQSADTWEVGLSTGGDKKEVFTKQLQENKLGTKALLMNLRNMLQSGVDQDLIIKRLETSNMKGIFPFELLKALWFSKEQNIKQELISKLGNMAYKSFENLPLEGKTAVLVDTSWSMQSTFGGSYSKIEYIDVGAFYGALVANKGFDVYAWADFPKKIEKWAGDSILRTIQNIRNTDVGYGTDLFKAIELVKNDYENVLVFSDMQTSSYVKNTGKIKKLFLFNLSGYNNSIAIKGNMIEISGFSDLMFKLGSDLNNIKNILKEINSLII